MTAEFLFGLVIGLVVGGTLGFICFAIMSAGARADIAAEYDRVRDFTGDQL